MPIDKLLNSIAKEQAKVEDLVESVTERYKSRVLELLEKPKKRNIDIWGSLIEFEEDELEQSLGLQTNSIDFSSYFNITLSQLNLIEMSERQTTWEKAVSIVVVGSQAQAMIESGIVLDIIGSGKRQGKSLLKQSRDMSIQEIKTAAKQGVSKQRLKDSRNIKEENV